MMIVEILLWFLRVVPLVLVYAPVFSFIGYIIDPDNRNSGKWYADIYSTLGIFIGIAFAIWLAM